MHLNIHYLYSKLDEIRILLSQQPNIDILCFCETFLNDQFHDTVLSLDNYQLFRKNHKTNRGGLAIYIKDSLSCTLRDDLQVDGIVAESKFSKAETISLSIYIKTTIINSRLDCRF